MGKPNVQIPNPVSDLPLETGFKPKKSNQTHFGVFTHFSSKMIFSRGFKRMIKCDHDLKHVFRPIRTHLNKKK
jgi:hypothetical protein